MLFEPEGKQRETSKFYATNTRILRWRFFVSVVVLFFMIFVIIVVYCLVIGFSAD